MNKVNHKSITPSRVKAALSSIPYHASIDAVFDQIEHDRRLSAASAVSRASGLGKDTKYQASQENQLVTKSRVGSEQPFYRFTWEVSQSGHRLAVDPETGEMVEVSKRGKIQKSREAARSDRFKLQNEAARLLPDSRTARCLRRMVSNHSAVRIHKSIEHGVCHYSGLQVCGSVWACPVCAAKVSEHRRKELSGAAEKHKERGDSLVLVTLTFPHSREDDLKDLLSRLSKAVAGMKAHRDYKRLKRRYHQIGTVRALEVTHGSNGWHPHIHELWFVSGVPDLSLLKQELYSLWSSAAVRAGLEKPSLNHGVDVQNGDFAEAYISKWGHEPTESTWSVDQELTKLNIKSGKSGFSPFDLLRASSAGDKQAGALFVEYVQAFRGQRQLFWSRGLKALFEVEELSDSEIAEKAEDTAQEVCALSPSEWKRIVRYGCRLTVLLLAEKAGGADLVYRYIDQLPGSSSRLSPILRPFLSS